MVHVWAAIIVIGQLSRQQQLPLYACLKDCRNRLSVEITMLVLVWCTNNQGGKVTAGRGVEKVEPGSEKFLGVGLNFKIGICPAHPRPGVGLEKLRSRCEAYAKIIKQDHKIIHI